MKLRQIAASLICQPEIRAGFELENGRGRRSGQPGVGGRIEDGDVVIAKAGSKAVERL